MLQDLQEVNRAFPWFFQGTFFILGAVVGSFLNVCIFRIPEKKSIISPGSTCVCGKPVAWYDNIPILSWFILRGRARCCGQPYSFRYPFVEALAGALFLLAWLEHPPAKAMCIMLFISLMICASFIDLDHMEIPDRFSIGTAFFGLLLSFIVPALHDYNSSDFIFNSLHSGFESFIGVMIGSGIILWLALGAEAILRKEAMGFGDVKLLGGIGAFVGWQGAVFGLFGGAVIGTVALAFYFAFNALRKKGSKSSGETKLLGNRTPFGPMLAGGAIVYLLFLEEEVDQYFELLIQTIQYSI